MKGTIDIEFEEYGMGEYTIIYPPCLRGFIICKEDINIIDEPDVTIEAPSNIIQEEGVKYSEIFNRDAGKSKDV